jgi:hypothetical protein
MRLLAKPVYERFGWMWYFVVCFSQNLRKFDKNNFFLSKFREALMVIVVSQPICACNTKICVVQASIVFAKMGSFGMVLNVFSNIIVLIKKNKNLSTHFIKCG